MSYKLTIGVTTSIDMLAFVVICMFCVWFWNQVKPTLLFKNQVVIAHFYKNKTPICSIGIIEIVSIIVIL